MADGVFNIAKGRHVYYATLPATNDAIIVVLLKSSGLEADATLADYDDLAALLAASNDECDFTNYARKTITSGTTPVVDDTNNRVDWDMADQSWASAGGAANNTTGKALVCYDPDTTGGTDSSVIPLTYHDFTTTTDGSTLNLQVAAAGVARAS